MFGESQLIPRWKVFLEYFLASKLPSSFFFIVKLDDLMMDHHVHKLQAPELVLRKRIAVINSPHCFSSIQLNINLSLSPGYIKMIWCKTSYKEIYFTHRNIKDGTSNSHVSYTKLFMDLVGWNEHKVEQSSGFGQ